MIAVSAISFAWIPAEAGPERTELFGSEAARFAGAPPSRKFLGAIERFVAERALSSDCRNTADKRCMPAMWDRLLVDLGGADWLTQIERVNGAFNRVAYVEDAENYGLEDYWATPGEFLARGGDCEDYALAKFLALRALGFDDASLRLAVVWDRVLGIGHAVLVVSVEGRELVLDNRFARPVPSGDISDYNPLYAVSERAWWLFKGKTNMPVAGELQRAAKSARGAHTAPAAARAK